MKRVDPKKFLGTVKKHSLKRTGELTGLSIPLRYLINDPQGQIVLVN